MDQFNRKRPHGGMTKNQAKKQKFNENILSEAPQGNFLCQWKSLLHVVSKDSDCEIYVEWQRSLHMLYVSFNQNFLNITCTKINKTIQFWIPGTLATAVQLKLIQPYHTVKVNKTPPLPFFGSKMIIYFLMYRN